MGNKQFKLFIRLRGHQLSNTADLNWVSESMKSEPKELSNIPPPHNSVMGLQLMQLNVNFYNSLRVICILL